MMVIKQYKLDPVTKHFDYERHFEVPDELAYDVMSTDPRAMASEIDNELQGLPAMTQREINRVVVPLIDGLWQESGKLEFLYEAGRMVGGTFYIKYMWQSTNGKLFKQLSH